jgi:hypothetical protein
VRAVVKSNGFRGLVELMMDGASAGGFFGVLVSMMTIGTERVAWFLIKMDQPMFKTLQKCLHRN